MVTRLSIAGLVLIVLGLLIVVVHGFNMGRVFSVETMLSELGLILTGIAVQLLGIGLILANKK